MVSWSLEPYDGYNIGEPKRVQESSGEPSYKIPIDGLGKQGTIKNKLSTCSNIGFYITPLLFSLISDSEVGSILFLSLVKVDLTLFRIC